jgi:hypothetical protein
MTPPALLRSATLLFFATLGWATAAEDIDVCVYGATPAGIVAAVTAKQEGMRVLLIEPSRWVGGILGAGLKPSQDAPEPRAVGGLTKSKVFALGDSPPVIRENFLRWLKEEGVPVEFERRLVKVEKPGTKITRATFGRSPPDKRGVPPPTTDPSNVQVVTARIFIDATYEGDLMAAAGVRYSIGREPATRFNEKPAGVGPPTNWTPINPFRVPADSQSGLLPLVDADHGRKMGEGDDYTQAYNFRFYITSEPERRAPLGRPANYNPKDFELVGRYVEYLVKVLGPDQAELLLQGMFPGWRNRGDMNYQRRTLFSIAPLGVSRAYQDGDWAARSAIWQAHLDYLSGVHHFLCTDSRVPEYFRQQTTQWGLDRTMHPDTEGWPNQLYVRIARRMNGPYVLTHDDVLNRTTVSDGVGLAIYGVDTYPVRRYVARHPQTGQVGVATEGNMFIGGPRGETGRPYAVPYRALTPKADECVNLLVPVCISASYIAYASARMEPVFCILGESAAVAAAHAIRASVTVQEIDATKLRHRLRERGQILEWKL